MLISHFGLAKVCKRPSRCQLQKLIGQIEMSYAL